ncbi:MAG: ABC transporter transmembrane domain-containing protein, partial [Rhizobium leguminosarum]
MEAAESRTQSVSSDTVTGILKRIIAENGRDHLWGYVFAIACLIVVALSTAFTAWIMRAIIDEAFANRRADVVWIICLSIFIAFVLRGFASYGQAVALSRVGNDIVARYQRRLYAHLMTLSVGFFSEARSAHIAAQVSQNVSGIRDVLNLTITSTVRDLLTFVSLLAVMILQDPLLSLAVFIMAPPLLYALRYVSKRLRSATREAVHLNSHVLGAMQETIQGIA